MGLCKCSKRKVTNLFCFVHRVNVCEHCIVDGHTRCVVRSYLQWLQDSDYDSGCVLCAKSLNEGDVVRLACLDLFHLHCLDEFVLSLPSEVNTADFKCPQCKIYDEYWSLLITSPLVMQNVIVQVSGHGFGHLPQDVLFPPRNMVSPVVDLLHEALQEYPWGRKGLGIVSPEEEEEEILTTTVDEGTMDFDSQFTSTPRPHPALEPAPDESFAEQPHADHVTLQLQDHPTNRAYQREWPVESKHGQGSGEEDKYRQKSSLEWLTRWFRQQHQHRYPQDDVTTSMKKFLMLAIFACLVVVTVIVLFTRAGRSSASRDSGPDWKFNPHIKTGE